MVGKRCWVLICNLTNAQWLSGDWTMSMGKHYPTFQVGIDFKHLVRVCACCERGIGFQRAALSALREESGHSKAIFVVFDTTTRLSLSNFEHSKQHTFYEAFVLKI